MNPFKIFKLKPEERIQAGVMLLVIVVLNGLFIWRMHDLFLQEGFGPFLSSMTDIEGKLHEGDIYSFIWFDISEGSLKADHSESRFCAQVLSYNCSGTFKVKELQDSLQDVKGEIQVKVKECKYHSDFVNQPSPWPFIQSFILMDHFSLQGDTLLTFEGPKGIKMCFRKYGAMLGENR